MKILAIFRKSLIEQLREPWLLGLMLGLTPFFVLLFSLVFGAGAWRYRVVVVDHDRGAQLADGRTLHAGEELAKAIADVKNATGASALRVVSAASRQEAERMLTNGRAHAMIEVPAELSDAIVAARARRPVARPKLTYEGDLTSQSYMVAAVLALTAVSNYVERATDQPSPVELVEKPLGGSGARSELDMAIPGLFVFGIILLLFPVAMSLAREAESGTLRRLMQTRLTSFDLLAGLSLTQLLLGLAVVLCSYGTAMAVGFRSQGPLWAGLLVCVAASFSAIGVGLLVACFSRSVTEAFILGNFPMILMMFFSGAMIPIPKVPLFSVGSVTVGAWDWLPTTHAVSAMNKIMGIGLGFRDVIYELSALVVLSAANFALGVWLFKRRRMVAA